MSSQSLAAALTLVCAFAGAFPNPACAQETEESAAAAERAAEELRAATRVSDESIQPDEVDRPSTRDKKYKVTMSLEQALKIAIHNNLDPRIESLNRDIARRDIIIERAVFDPFFSMGFAYTKSRDATVSPLDFNPLNPVLGVQVNPADARRFSTGLRGTTWLGTQYSLNFFEDRFDNPDATLFALNPRWLSQVQFSVTQPLLKNAWWGYNTANIRIAKNNLELSREQFQLTVIDLVYNVIVAYWELVFARRNFAARAKALEVAAEQVQIDRQRARIGTIAEIDLTTSLSQLARRKTEYDDALSAAETARDDLLFRVNYTGDDTLKKLWEKGRDLNPFDNILVEPTTGPSTDRVVPERGESFSLAFNNRPEYRQAVLDLKNKKISLEVSKNQLLPALDVTASWTQFGLDDQFDGSVQSLDDGRFYTWSVGVNFEIPLPYRGPISFYRRAQDELRKSQLEKEKLDSSIPLEVNQAVRDLEFAHRAVVNLQELVRLQQALLNAERLKLEVGKSIPYFVTQIENDLIDIQAQELRAVTDFESAKANYQKSVGTLLERWSIDLWE